MAHLLGQNQDDAPASFFGPDRQRFTLFFVAALWIHLVGFHLWGAFGLSDYYAINYFELPQERYLELSLELAGPTEPPGGPAQETLDQAALAPEPPEELAEPTEPITPDESSLAPLVPSTNLVENTGPQATPLPELPDNTVNLEDAAPEFKSYHTYVRSAVARHWILPPEARNNFKPGRFTAIMTISREGQILSIVVEESSNSSALDFAAMEALRGAAPYPPFPEELMEFSQLNFRLHFDYRAIQRRVGSDHRQSDQ
ncbi:MAG: TonB C-terminal domain-containing protein [Deltaproteobacteria bacterium]|jgi:TonB family protein|nr:TonB C-terminal domain-containing protein [Deltaproteobacteria bacterium]